MELKPSDWDEEEDGAWEPNQITNPKCKVGCGPWRRPVKANPAYKGAWKRPVVSNPAFKCQQPSMLVACDVSSRESTGPKAATGEWQPATDGGRSCLTHASTSLSSDSSATSSAAVDGAALLYKPGQRKQ
ncbi:Calnexin 1 [Tetrabaena socialis]|uniref:Calnexin 1 n=1 Tax=Tetrabaena socialis TaxID=47790 RepID=A0A2J8AFL4_9CHLO|nr:Calnexin 1 [Tetrabaena socialis]|eukprot:PNH11313.1 Calnexin 1 [Tetrabaena socialis]